MKLTCATCAALCLLFVFVSAAEESADPSITSSDVKVSNLEQHDHGPLMKHLLSSGEGILNRQKRTYKIPQKGGYSGGGCSTCNPCKTCGGGGGGSGSYSHASASSSSGSWGKK